MKKQKDATKMGDPQNGSALFYLSLQLYSHCSKQDVETLFEFFQQDGCCNEMDLHKNIVLNNGSYIWCEEMGFLLVSYIFLRAH